MISRRISLLIVAAALAWIQNVDAQTTPPFQWVNRLPERAHPALRHRTFESTIVGEKVGYVVLLPPGYDDTSRRYPVVYYLHGGRPGSETKGTGIAPSIVEVQRQAELPPTIYVFVNGGPISHYNVPPSNPPHQAGTVGADVFIRELIPHVDATYRTIADRRSRGLEGFSQGGRGTMRLALRHRDLFATAAAGGGGYATEKRISENDGFENPKLRFADGDNTWDLARRYASEEGEPVQFLIYVGTKGFNYENNLQYMRFLDSLGIKHDRIVVPGVKHSARRIYEQSAEAIMRHHASHLRGDDQVRSVDPD